MPQATLRVQVRNEFKDGIVVYASVPQKINIDDIIDVYGPTGNNLSFIEQPVAGFFKFLRFYTESTEFGVYGSQDAARARVINCTPSETGVFDVTYRVEEYYFISTSITSDSSRIVNTEYFQLRFIVKDAPPSNPPPAFLDIIKNSNLQMDVGVSQNIKVTFNSVYQTIYTRVTGLPAGMRYTGSPDGFLSGFISGAPLASGTYNVTISTTYKASEGGETLNTSKTIVYTVNDPNAPAILLADQNLTSGQGVNLPLRATDVSAIIGWSATGLPAGLTCGTGASAAITGTPTTAGTYNSTISLSCRKISSSETITVTKPVTFTIS